MCTCDVYDSPDFEAYGFRRAFKEHRCVECRRIIHRGARYAYYTQKWEGRVSTTKTCLRCDALSVAFHAVKDEPHCTYEFGGLRQAIRECADEMPGYWSAFRAAVKLERRELYRRGAR